MGRMLAGALAILIGWPTLVTAEQWRSYSLGDYAFGAPESWAVTLRRDDEIDLASPDGRYALWARLWFPDEPLLGYDDIVAHGPLTIAGQDALFRHSEFASERFLEYIFEPRDAQGRVFLFQLIGNLELGAELAEHQALFQRLGAELVVAGVPAVSGTASSAIAAPPDAPVVAATQPAGAEWIDLMNARHGAGDCRLLDLDRWHHPTRAVLAANGAPLRFVALCRDDTWPVFGVELPHDPRVAASNSYISPLLVRLFDANGQWDLSLIDPGYGALVDVLGRGRPDVSFEFVDLPMR